MVCVINYGCVIIDILVFDKDGNIDDISVGYDKIEGKFFCVCFFFFEMWELKGGRFVIDLLR